MLLRVLSIILLAVAATMTKSESGDVQAGGERARAEWKAVVSGRWLNLDPKGGPLEMLQTEKLGQGKWGHVEFLDADGKDAGGFSVEITKTPRFSIKGCFTKWEELKKPLPDAENQKRVWKFEKDLAKNELIVSVNGIEIHRVTLSTCSLTDPITIYKRTITQAKFGQTYNDAFQFYRQEASGIECELGFFISDKSDITSNQPAKQPDCLPCPPNTYTDVKSLETCKKCPVGSFSPPQSRSIDSCSIVSQLSKQLCSMRIGTLSVVIRFLAKDSSELSLTCEESRYVIPKTLVVGDAFTVWATYSTDSPRFGINVEDAAGDFLFRLTYHPANDPLVGPIITINEFKGGKWGARITAPVSLLKDGKDFEMKIVIEKERYQVYLESKMLNGAYLVHNNKFTEAKAFSLWSDGTGIKWNKVAHSESNPIPA